MIKVIYRRKKHMSIAITSLGGSGPREIMVDATTIAGTDEEIAAVIGNVDVGTIIYTAGFGVIKQKGLDGSWVEVQ